MIFVAIIAAGVASYWPSTVEFSYNQKTCTGKLTVAPHLFETVGSDNFRIEADQPVMIGNVQIATRSVCFIPVSSPLPGEHTVTQAPFGWAFIGKTFRVIIAKHPVVSAIGLAKPVPVSKPLEVALSTADSVFSYNLKVNDKTQPCQNKQQKISCDLTNLNLAQGKDYNVHVDRYFASRRVGTVL